MPDGPDFTFIHFSDTHLMAGLPPGTVWGDTAAALRHVVRAVNALEPAPAFAVAGGDLVSPDILALGRRLTADEYEPSYRLLREVLGELACPTHLLLGNHDHRAAFGRVMLPTPPARPFHAFSFDHQGWHFVGLDSHDPGQASGLLGPEQLAWLDQDLRAHADRPTVAFVHHHPWPLGLAWLDAIPLRDGEELTRRLGRQPQVRWLVCGHVHQEHTAQRGALTVLTTPATSVQLSKSSQTKKVLPGAPALRLVRVRGGELSTRVLTVQPDGTLDL